jgi:hypothetical protein
MSWPELLHPTLTRRVMPEGVAAIITSNLGQAWARDWTRDELHLLKRVASAHPGWYVSSMPEDFEVVPDATIQVRAALRMFGVGMTEADIRRIAGDWRQLAELIDRLGGLVGWRHGMDWKADRLPKSGRVARHAGGHWDATLLGHRAYNRHVRVLRNLWDKTLRMKARQEFRRLLMIGRSGFACDIPLKRFTADPAAAALIAYLAARKNVRREFTLAGRGNAVDQVAAMLFDRCAANPETDWAMIAQVWPKPDVLAHLGDEDLGSLMGRWWTVMRDCSVLLAGAWPGERDPDGPRYQPGVDRAKMIVHKGIDSSTWNTMAQAYNAGRAGWLGCAAAIGAGALTAPFCPGKVMRLMAGDLAYWHDFAGGGVDPDTRVWSLLPYPWDVINGLAECTAADVAAACALAGVNPVTDGWTAPLAPGAVAQFRPTPDLVHGVQVSSPEWAGLLRRAGVFSGKKIRGGDEGLRASAEQAGVITGELPVYAGGQYAGTTHHPLDDGDED